MKEELEPCPFCRMTHTLDHIEERWRDVQDPILGTITHREYILECCYLTFGPFRTIPELIKKWNMRTP